MKPFRFVNLLILTLVLMLSACSGNVKRLSKPEMEVEVARAQLDPGLIKLEHAQQTVALALEYFDQGAYKKSSELFMEAADLYGGLNSKDEERRALIAAAKVQLKCSEKQAFLLAMARYKGMLDRLEMPKDEERFLINLSDHMKGKPLTYPVSDALQVVFKD